MTVRRRLVFIVSVVVAAAVAWACVGDDPETSGTNTSPDSGSSSGDTGTSSSGGSSGSTDGGGITCSGGEIPCDGVCINPKMDKKHCGRCVHDCGNGDCTDGVCKHVVVQANALQDGGASITSLQTEQTDDNPKGLAQRVFWSVVSTNANAVGVYQDNVLGGNTTKLSTSSVHVNTNVVVDQTTVYWSANDFTAGQHPIWKGTVNGSASQTAYATMNLGTSIRSIAYDPAAKNVIGFYATGSNTLGPFKCPPAGGTCTSLGATSTGAPSSNVAIDNANMYFADDQGVIHRNELTISSGSTYVQTEATPTLLRVDGDALFWANKGDKKIKRGALISPQTVVPLATSANEATGLAADAANVYWTDPTLGTVNYAPRTGTGPNTPYVTLGPSATPMRLVRDTGFLYFTHNSGIYRVALP